MRMFDYEGHTFRIDNMQPETAFHVSRRLLPLVSTLTGFLRMRDDMIQALDAEEGNIARAERMLSVAKPLIDALASMPDDNAEYVLHACLARVFMVQAAGKAQSPVYNTAAGSYQHQLKLPTLLMLTGMSIMENLTDFFPAGGPLTKAESPQT